MRQEFKAPVEQVAAGDIRNEFRCAPPADTPESKRQADFAACTGIWCPREARETLESLMAHHGFDARELRAAWQHGSLSFDRQRRTLTVSSLWFAEGLAYGLILMVLAVVADRAADLDFAGSTFSPRGLSLLGVSVLVVLATIWLAVSQILWPHRVSQRVGRALQNGSPAASLSGTENG